MTPRPILIVDDDFAVREIVQQVLALEGYAVIEAATGRAGVHAWEQHDPQLIILDIVMPGLSGLQVLTQLRQKGDTPVIMLTRKSSEDDKVQAFELGADDYLSKPFSSRDLVVRVKAVLRRAHGPLPSTSPTAVQAGDLRLELDARHATIGERLVVLSRLECQILAELARTPARVLSHAQLLTAVWGPEYADEAQLLRCAIYRLRQKLEPDPAQPTYLRAARDAGYWLATAQELDA
jgi:two-component system response regulator RegX3